MRASIKSRAVELYLGDRRRDRARAFHRRWRRLRGAGRELVYAHQVDDPYGLLLLSVLPELVRAAELSLRILVIPTPRPAFAPERARLRRWALEDARRLAATHQLPFPAAATPPDDATVERALAAALAVTRGQQHAPREQLTRLRAIGEALFEGAPPRAAEPLDRARLDANLTRLHRLGHYQGGMLYYEGEWYWGLDRLPFLLARLRDEGLELPAILDDARTPFVAPSETSSRASALELFFSFRSPYSYLAFQPVRHLAARHGIELRVRLVLPMVMRGLAVPWLKRRYIVKDCQRIARARGVPFGRIADPVGAGVERCMAVASLARREGRLDEWIHSASTGIWSEGVPVNVDRGLRALALRAGLDPDAAIAATRDADVDARWRAETETNRVALLEMGLWGVPSLRLGELTLWGQDRVDVLEAALRARG